MTTTEIVEEFNALVDCEKTYTLMEFKKLASDVYKSKTGQPVKATVKKTVVPKDDDESDSEAPAKRGRGRPRKVKLNKDGSERKKRAPSAYNAFIKAKYAELKPHHPGEKAPAIMALAAAEWRNLSEEEKEAYKASLAGADEGEQEEEEEGGVSLFD